VLPPDQGEEGIAGTGFLGPRECIDDAGGRHRVLACADEPPPAAVGDDADRYPALAQHRLDAVDGVRRPQVARHLAGSRPVDDVHDRAETVASVERSLRADGYGTVWRLRGDTGDVAPGGDSAQPATSRSTVSTHLSRAER
jgi:hypothetical protein